MSESDEVFGKLRESTRRLQETARNTSPAAETYATIEAANRRIEANVRELVALSETEEFRALGAKIVALIQEETAKWPASPDPPSTH